jgi:hypothetical protein
LSLVALLQKRWISHMLKSLIVFVSDVFSVLSMRL